MRPVLLILTAILSITLSSCGYTLSGSSGMDGSGTNYKSLFIPTFVNDTYEPGVESALTGAVKEEIVYDSRWRLTDSGDADLFVTGRVTSVDLLPLTYDAVERIQEYRIRIVSAVSIADRDGNVVWKESGMVAFADYRVTEDVTKSKINKSEAVKKASKNFAEEFVIKVLDVL